MGQISSIHLKPSKAFNVWHNADIRPSYAIDSSGNGLWFNRSGLEAQRLKEQIIARAKKNYQTHCKARNKAFQAKSYEWSAVVNLKPDSTQEDLERLAQHFSDKYGFQCYQIAIHRDEGHIDNGQKIINHHAHLEFITLDKETGKNHFRGSLRTPKALSQMQSEVAEILQMERGVDKRLSRAKRIEPRAYGAMKEAEKAQNREREQKIGETLDRAHEHIETQNTTIATLKGENENLKNELLTQKQINERFSAERKAMIERGGHTAEGYKAMTTLKNELKAQKTTNEQLESAIAQLREKLENECKAREKAENERDEQRVTENERIQSIKAQSKQEIENLKSELHRAQQEKAELQGKIDNAETDFNDFLQNTIAERDKEWQEIVDNLRYENYENELKFKKELDDLKNQFELSTNAQNNDSNTKTFKNH